MAGDVLPIKSKLLISHQHVGQHGFENRHALNTNVGNNWVNPPDIDVQDEEVRSTEKKIKFDFSPLTVYNTGKGYISADGGE